MLPGSLLGAIVLARPAALVLLVLPLVVLWFLRRAAARPHVDATGTLEIWQRSVLDVPRSAAKPRLPLSLWFVVLALVFGALALAGPRSSAASSARTLLVVVDRSPSMYLRDGSGTRLEHALELARTTISRLGNERVAWIAPPIADDETRAPNVLPDDWLAAPQWSVTEPDFTAFDRSHTLFVTDHALTDAPRFAGFVCSGGAAVPGAIGVDGDRTVVWDGTQLADDERAPPRIVELDSGLPDAVARIAQVWASAHGLASNRFTTAEPDAAAVLVLYGYAEHRAVHPCQVARDGWSARAESAGPLPLRDGYGSLARWLETTEGEVVVAQAAGRVHVALRSIEEQSGDPAAWAVSWSRLFDEALALPRGSVSVAERLAAGGPLTRDPSLADANDVDSIGPWTAITAGIAALLALAAAGLGLVSRGVAVG